MDLFYKPEALHPLTKIARFLAEEGILSYLVGGFVRDALLGRDTFDIDIAVDADALETARRVAGMLNSRYVPLDKENCTGRVVVFNDGITHGADTLFIDFSRLRGTIEQDLSQRDFSINAMAIKIDDSYTNGFDADRIIDPFGGQEDLQQKLIRAVDDDAFREDAVRLLRAVRISAELDFSIEDNTEALIKRDCRLVADVAGERIREELLRILALPGAGPRLAYLDKLALLMTVMPELAPTRDVDQPKIHIWDVLGHSIQTVSTVEFLLRERPWEYASEDILSQVPWSDALSIHFDIAVSSGSTHRSLLKLAALLHDIAKPQTKTIDNNGRARFTGHSKEGASVATTVLERLRFSNKEIQFIELLINQHLRPMQMSQEGLPSRRAIYRFFRDTGEMYIDVLFLSLADHLATRGLELDPVGWNEHIDIIDYIFKAHQEQEVLSAPIKLLDGHDLIKEFGLQPGPEIGRILESIREMQADGELATRREAIDFVKHYLQDKTRKDPDTARQKEP